MSKNNKVDTAKKQKLLSKQLSANPDQIKITAYYIWEQKGRPENSALEDWLEAEKRVNKPL